MSLDTWTTEELTEFERLIYAGSGHDLAARIRAQRALKVFNATHSKKKCDAMWVHLHVRDSE